MAPQKACHGRCIVTMVAFLLTFSFVGCQMSPQIACSAGCKVTLAAFKILFLLKCVLFKCLLKSPMCEDANAHWLHLLGFSPLHLFKCVFKCLNFESNWLQWFDFSPLCVVKCLLKSPAREDEKSHWLQLFDLFHCAFSHLS